MKLESMPRILDFEPFSTRTEAEGTHNLGEEVRLADGRVFRFAKAGATAISKGKLQIAPAPKTGHDNMTTAAAAAGVIEVTVTPATTDVVADEYAEGYLSVNDVDGEGQTYKIKSHPAATAGNTMVVTLFDPIKTALIATSQTTFVHNAYNGVVEGTSATRRAAGVPLVNVAIGDYCWLQVKGVCSVLVGSARALSAWQMADASTAGATTDHTDVTAPQAQVIVGYSPFIAGVTGEYNPMVLTID